MNYIRFLRFKENLKKTFGEFGKMYIVSAVLRCLPVCTATLFCSGTGHFHDYLAYRRLFILVILGTARVCAFS